jgi:hypothetical protein
MSKHHELGTAVVETLSSGEVQDLIKEYAEIGIDAALSDGPLKDIPVISTIIGLAKVGISISDRILIRKIIKFLGPLSDMSDKMRQEMIQKLETDAAYGRKVGEHLIEILDRLEAHRKPQMIASVFKAYAKGEIDATLLHRLNYAIDRIPSYEISEVRRIHEMPHEERLEANAATLQALLNAGLVNVISGYGALVYEPNDLCEIFLGLNLDRVDA